MANTTIKITQLQNIGNGLASNTLLPVVNTTGTAITQKVTVGNVANFIMGQAGNTLSPAYLANLAYSVVNAAQPNITSVGTLNVNTLRISGGTNGQYLQTNGSGVLSWSNGGGSGNGVVGGSNSQLQFNLSGSFAGDPELTWDAGNNQLNTVNFAASTATIYGNVNAINVNASGNLRPNAIYTDHYYYANGYIFGGGGGNGEPGGADTQIQFNDNGAFGGNTGFTFDKTTGIFTSPFLAGNGNGLANIQGANISGFVPNANVANTAFAVAGANVTGAVTYAGTANSVAVANVVGIGNIATLALDGSNSNVLYGNGVFAPATATYGNSNVVTLLSSFGSNTINTTGNITLGNAIFSDSSTLSGSVLTTPVSANIFAGTSLPGLETDYTDSVVMLDEAFTQNSGVAGYPWGITLPVSYLTYDELIQLSAGTFPNQVACTVIANNVQNNYEFWQDTIAETNVTLTANELNWTFKNDGSTIFPTLTVDIHNGGNQTAQTLQFGDATQQAIITGPTPASNTNAQRLIIQGQRASGTGEGGDVYLWAGDSDTNGGDIKIYAGDADSTSSGSGGYVNIDGGAGFDNGGDITLTGGVSANGTGGSVGLAGGQGQVDGGPINIQGGYGATGQGGRVNILGGSSSAGQSAYGNVEIGSGTYAWVFDNSGNLTLPSNDFTVNYANGTQVNIGGGGANTGNVTFDDVTVQGVNQLNLSWDPLATANLSYLQVRGGDVASHIHLDTGNNNAYDLIVGDDAKFVQVSSTGDIIMSSYDGNTSYIWTFDQEGNLILAGGESAIQSVANSSLDPLNSNVSTMILTPSRGYSSQSLVLDPTAPGHIHLRAPSANIDEPLANIFLGGEESSFEVGYHNGSAPNLFIHSGNNTWTFDNIGSLNLPTLSLGNAVNEQTIIQSQRKIIPPFRYSVEIDGTTPTTVYTATDNSITSMKVTMQIQHTGLGMEFFDVSATYTGPDTYYTVSNRVQPPTIANSTVVVDLNGSNAMEITVTINSGAANSWVTYDATEFGIAVD